MNTQRFSTDGLDVPVPKPKACDPAQANLSGEWHETVGKLGFTVVIVQMGRCPETFSSSEFVDLLGEEMRKAGIGHLDSSQWQPKIRFFFYARPKRLGEAMQFLKSGLEKSDLLKHSAIGNYDATVKAWREFYPGIEP